MFKVNNKDTRTMPGVVLVSLLLNLSKFHLVLVFLLLTLSRLMPDWLKAFGIEFFLFGIYYCLSLFPTSSIRNLQLQLINLRSMFSSSRNHSTDFQHFVPTLLKKIDKTWTKILKFLAIIKRIRSPNSTIGIT